MTEGWWHTNFFCTDYWHEDYWQDYGTATPSGGKRRIGWWVFFGGH